MLGTFRDYGLDTDGDSKYNFLVIEVDVNITDTGNYTITGWLTDKNDQDICYTEVKDNLNEGHHNLSLRMKGEFIYQHGIDGPYKLGYVTLRNDDHDLLDNYRNAFSTKNYTYADFQTPAQLDISISPTSYNFGNIAVGSTKIQAFTITNTGSVDLVIGNLSITGMNASEFSIQNDNCSGQTIAPSRTCTVDVKFSPTSTGAKSATLNIPSNDPDKNPLSVSLTNAEASSTNGKSGGGGSCFIDTVWSFVKKESQR